MLGWLVEISFTCIVLWVSILLVRGGILGSVCMLVIDVNISLDDAYMSVRVGK